MSHQHCPHCARLLSEVGATSRDHAVTEALGGVETVRTCKVCNDVLGRGVEARLLSRTGWFTLLSQAQGWTDGVLSGRSEHGQAVQSHVGDEVHRLMAPRVEVVVEDGRAVQLGVTLPPHIGDGYLNHLAEQYGGTPSVVSRQPAPPEWFRYEISVDIADVRRLVAKTALGTGTRRWGDEFVLSPLAGWLREVQDVWQDWPAQLPGTPAQGEHAGGRWPMAPEELASLTEQLQRVLPPILARVADGRPVAGHVRTAPPMTLLLPVDCGRQTVVAVIVLGVLLPLLTAPHSLPGPRVGPAFVVHPERVRRATLDDPDEQRLAQ